MMDIIEAEAALYAKPVVVCGTIATVDGKKFVLLYFVRELTSNAAVWTN